MSAAVAVMTDHSGYTHLKLACNWRTHNSDLKTCRTIREWTLVTAVA
jgi:hypothetical protein